MSLPAIAGRNQGGWFRRNGNSWRPCDASVPALAVQVELEHAYYNLELLDHRRFGNGVIYVRHAVRNPA